MNFDFSLLCSNLKILIRYTDVITLMSETARPGCGGFGFLLAFGGVMGGF
jgi:hypothetical protein